MKIVVRVFNTSGETEFKFGKEAELLGVDFLDGNLIGNFGISEDRSSDKVLKYRTVETDESFEMTDDQHFHYEGSGNGFHVLGIHSGGRCGGRASGVSLEDFVRTVLSGAGG